MFPDEAATLWNPSSTGTKATGQSGLGQSRPTGAGRSSAAMPAGNHNLALRPVTPSEGCVVGAEAWQGCSSLHTCQLLAPHEETF